MNGRLRRAWFVGVLLVILLAGGLAAFLTVPAGRARGDLTLEPTRVMEREEFDAAWTELRRQLADSGIDHVLIHRSSRDGYAVGVIVDDPGEVTLTGLPTGLVTVFTVPPDLTLRDGALWLPIPDDVVACEGVNNGLCRMPNGDVEYRENGCRYPPTTNVSNFSQGCSL